MVTVSCFAVAEPPSGRRRRSVGEGDGFTVGEEVEIAEGAIVVDGRGRRRLCRTSVQEAERCVCLSIEVSEAERSGPGLIGSSSREFSGNDRRIVGAGDGDGERVLLSGAAFSVVDGDDVGEGDGFTVGEEVEIEIALKVQSPALSMWKRSRGIERAGGVRHRTSRRSGEDPGRCVPLYQVAELTGFAEFDRDLPGGNRGCGRCVCPVRDAAAVEVVEAEMDSPTARKDSTSSTMTKRFVGARGSGECQVCVSIEVRTGEQDWLTLVAPACVRDFSDEVNDRRIVGAGDGDGDDMRRHGCPWLTMPWLLLCSR